MINRLHKYSFLGLCLLLMAANNLSAYLPGTRGAIQDLTRAISEGKITEPDARKKAVNFKIKDKDLRDAIVNELIITADREGIQDITNPAMVNKITGTSIVTGTIGSNVVGKAEEEPKELGKAEALLSQLKQEYEKLASNNRGKFLTDDGRKQLREQLNYLHKRYSDIAIQFSKNYTYTPREIALQKEIEDRYIGLLNRSEQKSAAEKPAAPINIPIQGKPVIGEPIAINIPEEKVTKPAPVPVAEIKEPAAQPKPAPSPTVAPTPAATKLVAKPKPGVAGQTIVYKVKDGGFAPLDDSDMQNYLGAIEQTSKNPGASNSVFDIILRYQWPTNMIFTDSFSAQDKKALFDVGSNPESFIRGKIQQAHPKANYDVMSIPDTIYQLFVINYFLTHLDDPIMHEMDSYLFDFFDKFQTIEGPNGPTVNLSSKRGFLDASKALYTNPRVAQSQFICNCAFGAYYAEKSNMTWQQVAADLISQIIPNYAKNKNKIPKHADVSLGFDLLRLNRELQGKNLVSNGIVDNMLKFEADAHQLNKGILIRAITMFQQEIEAEGKKQKLDMLDSAISFSSVDELRDNYLKIKTIDTSFDLETRGNSYGLYLFTGTFYCIFDMPYYYALTESKVSWDENGNFKHTEIPTENNYFYGLMFDKSSYVQSKYISALFLIPPFSSFTQLWGHDSLYHALSHIALEHLPILQEAYSVAGFEPVIDPHLTLFIKMDPLAYAAKLSEFVSNNAILLKVKQGANIQSEQSRLRQNLKLASDFYDGVRKTTKVPAISEQPAVHQ